MKILIVGKNQIMKWPQSVYRALTALSYETELFLFNKKNFSYCAMRLLGKKKRRAFLAKKLEQKINSFQPDLIFFVSAFFIPIELFNVLKKYPHITKIGWSADRFEADKAPEANCLDYLFCSDYGFLDIAKNFTCKSIYLPLCSDPIPSYDPNTEKTLPPLFAGVLNPTRTKYLSACTTRCVLYVKNCPKGQLTQHEVHHHTIPHSQMLDLISKSICPINVGLSVNNITGLNFRVFEVSACGGLIMVNKECADISRCYEVGKEAVVYDTPEDLNKLVQDAVQNPKKYTDIARAGYERTIKEHTYAKRMEQILKIISDAKK